jgi:MFS family permease
MKRFIWSVACWFTLAVLLACATAHAQEGVIVQKQAADNVPKSAGGQSASTARPEASPPERPPTMREQAEEKLSALSVQLDGHLGAIAGMGIVAWGLAMVAAVTGVVLMFFGWRLLSALFAFFSAFMGLVLGGFLGFQLVLALSSEGDIGVAAIVGLVGAAVGAVMFLLCALKAQPVAWMMIVLSPFLVVSTFVFPLNRVAQLIAMAIVVGGLVLGFISMMKRQPMVVMSTSLLGSVLLVFAFGLVAHLSGSATLRSVLDFVCKYPIALIGGIIVLMLVGADLQYVLAPGEHDEEGEKTERHYGTE